MREVRELLIAYLMCMMPNAIETEFLPDAAPDLPYDTFGPRMSAAPRDAIKAVVHILCMIGLAISHLITSTPSKAC